MKRLMILAAVVAFSGAQLAYASGSHDATKTEGGASATTGSSGSGMMSGGSGMMTEEHAAGPMILMPFMRSDRGRVLFAKKGCVVCHSINGIGGEDAPPLDASTMEMPMSPFDFAARMWRGAAAMIALQEDELGGQIEITGQELADIIAFVHDANEQKKFSDDDIPESMEKMLHGND
jgi:mono/diheme cytochrome c family protein